MELASLPLLLTMICLAYQETPILSGSRAELYKDAIDALLKKWDNSRNRARDEPYKQLTVRRKEDLFNMIAATTFERDEFFFREGYLINMIGDYLGRLPGMEDEHFQDAAARTLSAIEGNHGILVECARNVWSFAHLTFQEYFTASYVCLAVPKVGVILLIGILRCRNGERYSYWWQTRCQMRTRSL
jgi:predicted NACHT family NTPase